jgi:Flp pilus assembly protein TadD
MYRLCRAALIASAFVVAAPVYAATVAQEAQALIQQGQAAEALRKLDAHLAKNPQDAEARFARGLALVKLNRNRDAVRVFADLTRDYPQLPEPYNNLAVLYAAEGNYTKAREALEAALVNHPSYATAHENLGDIYTALAGAAYNKALQLESANATVRRKLSLINQLEGVADTAVAAAPTPAPAAPAPLAAAPAVMPAAAPAPPPAPAASSSVDAQTVAAARGALDAWTQAWSTKQFDAYFGAYADGFTPEGGLTRAAWEAQRRDRISRPQRIRVQLADVQFSALDGGRVRATFRQDYESDAFSDSVNKALELTPENGTWKIVREYTR